MSGGAPITLVTGGAGFIGSHVVDALLARGDRVRVLDRLHPAAHSGPPGYLNPDAEYVWGDIRDPDALQRATEGVDAVSHQAAMVGLGVNPTDWPEFVESNSSGTAALLAELHRHGFDGPLVLASSMVIYGEGRYRCPEHGIVAPPPRRRESLEAGDFEPACASCGRQLQTEQVPEDAAADPRSAYASTKLEQENLCRTFGRETGVPVCALRYHNVYGPRMPRDTPYAGVASIFRSALESGFSPRVFEDGRQLRDFVHVRDVAEANLRALGRSGGGVFNIASGQPRTILAMARELARSLDGPQPEVTGEYRVGDVRHVFAAVESARDGLGFSARIPFSDGIREFSTAPLRAPVQTGIG